MVVFSMKTKTYTNFFFKYIFQGPSIVTNQQIYQVSPYLSKFYFRNQILDFVLTFVSASYTLHVTMVI